MCNTPLLIWAWLSSWQPTVVPRSGVLHCIHSKAWSRVYDTDLDCNCKSVPAYIHMHSLTASLLNAWAKSETLDMHVKKVIFCPSFTDAFRKSSNPPTIGQKADLHWNHDDADLLPILRASWLLGQITQARPNAKSDRVTSSENSCDWSKQLLPGCQGLRQQRRLFLSCILHEAGTDRLWRQASFEAKQVMSAHDASRLLPGCENDKWALQMRCTARCRICQKGFFRWVLRSKDCTQAANCSFASSSLSLVIYLCCLISFKSLLTALL